MSNEEHKPDLRESSAQTGDDEPCAERNELLHVFKRGAEFTEELLKENERLRYRIAAFEAGTGAGGGDEPLVKELMEKVVRLEEERERQLQRFVEVEGENRDLASRCAEVETENDNLMNLYVASYQLHSTLDFQEVLHILTEVILNFVGAEVFCIALVSEQHDELRPLAAEGMEQDGVVGLSASEGVVGSVVRGGEPYIASDALENRAVTAAEPVVCLPLKIKERTVGVILVYRFLEQKTELATVDHELFTLLAGHAATALFSAKLYTESRRKLDTIQGLIDLVSS